MNRFSQNAVRVNSSGWGCGLMLLGVVALISIFGIQWLINSIAILLLLIFVVPVVAFWGVRWWLQRKLIESDCPSCAYTFMGFDGQECRCPNCGEPLVVKDGKFRRLTPPGTIDVDAVEVNVKTLDESP